MGNVTNDCRLHARGFGLALSFLCLSLAAAAQAAPAGAPLTPGAAASDGATAIGPPQRGFYASMVSTTSHDTVSGWSDEASPSMSYHFNPAFSVDTSLPYYLYLDAVKTTKKGTTRLIGHENALGDMAFAGHFHWDPDWFDSTFTAATGAPTGDSTLGLSAGQVTWNVNTKLEGDVSILSPYVELGFGDSSNLVRVSARKNYTSVGKLAFFEAGSSVDLPRDISFEAAGYEQLPIGNQMVYTSIVRKKKDKTTLTSTSDADDFGVTASLGMPLSHRVDVSLDYSYSVPLEDSSIGLSVSVLLWKPLGR